MICDHPFQFFIYDKTEELMCFEGRLGSPEIPETKPTVPLLNSVHSESHVLSESFDVDSVDPPANWLETKATNSSSIRSYISVKDCFSLVFVTLLGFALGFIL